MTFETVTSEGELAALAPEWDALVVAMPRPSPFLLHAWLLEWWRAYGDAASLAVHVARRDGRLVAALPLVVRRRRGLRVAELPGHGVFPLGDALLARDEPSATVAGLVEHARGSHDYASLYALPGSSRLAAAGAATVERLEAPVVDLTPGWDAVYRAKVSGKHRSVDRRKRGRLAELGRLEVRVARTWPELEDALEEAFRVHELRWGGRHDGSGFATPRGRRFHRAGTRALAEADVPRVVTLALDGRAIAFNFGLVSAGRFCSYRIGFDPEYARFSPGYLNNLDALEAAADEGLQAFEFLGGAEEHKLQLADRPDPLYDGFGLAGSARGRAAATLDRLLLEARVRARRSRRARALAGRARALTARGRG